MNKSTPQGPMPVGQAAGPVKPAMVVVTPPLKQDETAQDAVREREGAQIKAKSAAKTRDPIAARLQLPDITILNWEAGWLVDPVTGWHLRVARYYQIQKIAVDTWYSMEEFERDKRVRDLKKKLLNEHGVRYVALNPASPPQEMDAQLAEQAV